MVAEELHKNFKNQFSKLNESTVPTFINKYNRLKKMDKKVKIDSLPAQKRGDR